MGLAASLIVVWLRMDPLHMIQNSFMEDPLRTTNERAVAVSEGILETILVSEGDDYRRLFTNGHSMAATTYSARRYMKLFARMPRVGSSKNPATLAPKTAPTQFHK